MTAHTDREYEAELARIRADVEAMGEKVDAMIGDAVRALVHHDKSMAQRTIAADDEVDRLEMATDELCLRALAKRQPVASDLRFITTAMKMVTDLERMGDMAVDTSRRVLELSAAPSSEVVAALTEMAVIVRSMTRDALTAFLERDAAAATEIIERDAEVDAYYRHVVRHLVVCMRDEHREIQDLTRLQSVAKYLERVGDHATNLAEMVVFMVKGDDIRHPAVVPKPGD